MHNGVNDAACSGLESAVWRWIWAFWFGLFGAALGGSIRGIHPQGSALTEGLLGAILGAILGGAHDVVKAINRMAEEIRHLQKDHEDEPD